MNMSYGARQVPQKRVACGMTLIEMLCIIALVVCVIEGSKIGKQIIGHCGMYCWYFWIWLLDAFMEKV